jgi:GMP synthase (glutamine-hydrolysing)
VNQDTSHSEKKRILCLENIHGQLMLTLDFGSQYAQLISRRIRECGVYSEIHSYDISDEDIEAFASNGIIFAWR